MKCLFCGRQIETNATEEEKECLWHNKCIKKFFGTKNMPILDISESKLEEIAKNTINNGFTVPGVQKKLSLNLSGGAKSRLTIVNYPTGYILKPQTNEFAFLPEFEDLAMRLAEIVGIRTVPHALIKVDDTYAYITRRIDRDINIKNDDVKMYAMEDFCQLSNRLTQDKYKGSYELCGKVIKKYSEYPQLDMAEMFIRIVFSFVIGNSDMHLKNFSLRETLPGNRIYSLSDAYDLLPVNIIMPEDTEQLALTINGKKRNIRKKDFLELAQKCNINPKSAENMIKKISKIQEVLLLVCDNSYLPDELKERTKELIKQRINVIK